MPRVASLYLPNLAIDRLRRIGMRGGRPKSSPAFAGEGDRLQGGGGAAAKPPKRGLVFLASPPAFSPENQAEEGTRIEDCSCPRGGGWRPGARWARAEEKEALPEHRQPSLRELGRKSEAAKNPYKSSPGRGGEPPKAVEGALRAAQSPLHHAATRRGPPPRSEEELPLVTTHRSGQRIILAAASPEAQALGLYSGMALTHARMLVPGLDVRDADPQADTALLQRLVLFAARRWTPKAAVADPTGLWLDLSGVAHLFGDEEQMCRRILRFCARIGLTARIAVAGTHGAAHALARHSGKAIALCPAAGEAEAIAPLPLSALRVEEDVLAAASRLGIDRVGDLLAMPRAPLQRRFGSSLLLRLDQALGRAPEPIEPVVPEEPPSATLRFLEPIATAEAIAQVLADLMAMLIGRLEAKGLGARTLLLLCARVDGEDQQIGIGTARATRDDAHLLRLLGPKIGTIEPGFGIEAMTLVAARSEPLGAQPIEGALAGEQPTPDLAPLVDRLAGRLGSRRIFRLSAIESDVPERSVRRVGPLGPTMPWPRWPRPVRLLSSAEPVEQVMALLPDGAPRRFVWRGKSYVVRRADGPERIQGEWWRRPNEADAIRDYFQVEDEEGRRFWLYRRGDGENLHTGDFSWHLQGMFG